MTVVCIKLDKDWQITNHFKCGFGCWDRRNWLQIKLQTTAMITNLIVSWSLFGNWIHSLPTTAGSKFRLSDPGDWKRFNSFLKANRAWTQTPCLHKTRFWRKKLQLPLFLFVIIKPAPFSQMMMHEMHENYFLKALDVSKSHLIISSYTWEEGDNIFNIPFVLR